MNNHVNIQVYLYTTLVVCIFAFNLSFSQGTKPNIIVIMVDDMGYSDLGCTGAEINTPNLDNLANNGVLFTNAYNTSRCCPSRASLLTGQYQWDAGMGNMDTDNGIYAEYQGYLNEETATIAELLNDNGYQSFMAGKWHVGSKERTMWPDYHGFNQFYGTPAGGGIYFYPSQFYNRDVYWNGTQVFPDENWYSTDAFTDYAINYIKNDKDPNKPFFMYLAYIAPHFPLQAKDEDIAKYEDVYDVGYETIRNARFEKQKTLGIVSNTLPMSDIVYDWTSVSDKTTEARKMQVYAAMMDCLDQNIGKLKTALEEENIDDNTVIIFLSDNGGASTNFNRTSSVQIGGRNSNASYGKWYNVSNTPYRKAKTQEHEGGIITPMIVHWPNGLNNPGSLINDPVHIMDIMPTCLEIAGANYPTSYNNVTLDPLDGESVMPLLNGSTQDPNRIFFWEHEGNKAVRQGDWKLVALHNQSWELYKINEDPYELNNLATQEPTIFEDLKDKYQEWALEHGVRDWPNINSINAPKDLEATINADNASIDLVWKDGSNEEQGVKIERAINGGAFSTIANIAEADILVYNDTDVQTGNNYSYRVRQYIQGVTNSSYSNEVSILFNNSDDINVAEGKTIQAFSSQRSSYPASNAIDGDNASTSNNSRWLTEAGASYPHYLEIDLEGTFEISSLQLFTGYNGYASPLIDFKFQYWDGLTWQDLVTETNNANASYFKSFTTTETDKVRLEVSNSTSGIVRLFEIEVYGKASALSNEDFELKNKLGVYPNPIKGNVLYVKAHQLVKNIQLYSVLGEKIPVDYAQGILNVSHLKSGIYFLKINNKVNFKIIKW